MPLHRAAHRAEAAKLAALSLLVIALAHPAQAGAQAPADSTRAPSSPPAMSPPVIEVPGPVVADTMHVRRRALSLREIIERSIAGERGKLAGHHSITYSGTVRAVMLWDEKKLVSDSVFRTYAHVDGTERSVFLGEQINVFKLEDGEWVLDPDSDEEGEGVEVSAGGANDFEDLPLFFEESQEFDFELRDRFVHTDHVIFEVGFRPKSEFKPLPSGVLWIDTTAYRVIHEEMSFEKNPFPLVLKDLKRISRQWEELPGGEWVYTKIRAEVELRALPFGIAPKRVLISVERSDFEFDAPYDARVFGER